MNDTHDHGPSQMAGSGDWRSWNPSRRRFLTLTGLAVGGAVIGTTAAGCGTAQTGSQQGTGEQQGRPGASGETLFVAGFQWGPPKSFNPLAASPDFPVANGQPQYIYESLLRFNLLDGSLQPGLAKTVEQKDDTTGNCDRIKAAALAGSLRGHRPLRQRRQFALDRCQHRRISRLRRFERQAAALTTL